MSTLTIEQQKSVLKPYAAGADLRSISQDTGIDHDDVSALVSSLAFQRTRAAERLRQIEAGTKPAATVVSPAAVALPAKPALPVITVPGGKPDAIKTLTDAEAAGGRFATTAARIRRQIEQLAGELATNGEVIAAERRVEQLRRELAEATEKARLLKGGKAPSVAARDSNAAVRAWAAEHGVTCPAVGRIPTAVRAAYDKRETS